ncbi:TetR/AcrR family transcriptional regulator [Nocardioides sp. AE5]|uniref:TetR/AcrR family transcriptional regulator n=1 Tax=Nocardioides sp. AE5 TaxID=2962573 RepID=UPI002881AFFC|nr:TetR/AcrR family transcriptional regulator [Nocardioides sp. AE5]MDT0202667.1 TetR/AcrR family transcriptional regulator [Nocardioides sp. AE5]
MARTRRTARQADLLARLVDLIAAEGFADFTLDQVAERMSCSKTTLYALAPSKLELAVAITREFFRTATEQVEAKVAAEADPGRRVTAYLTAVGEALAPLSRAFMDDLADFAPVAEVYQRNTAFAAARIRDLIVEGIAAGALREVNAGFVAEMVAATMFEIQRGEMFERLDLSDAQAYAELARFVEVALGR